MAERVATYTLQGFLYQFLLTAEKILSADDDATITVEGIIEDIDIDSAEGTEAIQCKYYEQQNYSLSVLYKPILIMLRHYSNHQNKNLTYTIYLYVQNLPPDISLSQSDIEKIMKSKDQKLTPIIQQIPTTINIEDFLGHFKIVSGKSLRDLEKTVIENLKQKLQAPEFVEEIAFPNAITYINFLSTFSQAEQRCINKKSFLELLNRIHTTAYSKWAKMYLGEQKFLTYKQLSLKAGLQSNSRSRALVFHESIMHDEIALVDFIFSFVDKYASKTHLQGEPYFFLECSGTKYHSLIKNLHTRKYPFTECLVGKKFDNGEAKKPPTKDKSKKSFYYRIIEVDESSSEFFHYTSFDDIFVFGNKMFPSLYTHETGKIEIFDTSNIADLKNIFRV